jgi:hypothetical protein
MESGFAWTRGEKRFSLVLAADGLQRQLEAVDFFPADCNGAVARISCS